MVCLTDGQYQHKGDAENQCAFCDVRIYGAATRDACDAFSAALSADGPTKDCIPLGTRFMVKAGDNFPICKTKVVVKVAGVSDGLATLIGAGDIAAGATVPLSVAGCQAMVISADLSGYAELRVTCQ